MVALVAVRQWARLVILQGTTPHQRRFGLDVLRAAAAILVVIAHGMMYAGATFPTIVTPAALLATLGVEVFFVLSGFLIAPGLFAVCEGRMKASSFWLRRAWRTLPVFYIFLAANVLLALWLANDRTPSLKFAFFSQSLLSPAATAFFPESWSLAVEEWFYLIATLAAALSLRLGGYHGRLFYWWLLALVLLSPIARAAWAVAHGYSWDAGLRKLTLLRLDAIAIGVLVAANTRNVMSKKYAHYSALLGAAMIVFACAQLATIVSSGEYLQSPSSLLDAFRGALTLSLLGVGAALLLPAASAWPQPKPAIGPVSHAVSRVAHWSYAIYLCHFPLLLVFDRLVPGMRSENPAIAICSLMLWATATIVVAAIFYAQIERRILAYRDRLLLS